MNKAEMLKLISDIRSSFPSDWALECPEYLDPDSDAFEDTVGLWGRPWNELKVDDFHRRMYSFFGFPKETLPFFLGAVMNASLQEQNFFNDAVGLFLSDTMNEKGEINRGSCLLDVLYPSLSADQIIVFRRYLDFAANNVDPKWKALFENAAKALSIQAN